MAGTALSTMFKWIKGGTLNPVTAVLIRRPCEDTETHSEEGDVKTEEEIGVKHCQSKKCQEPPET